MKNFRPFRGGGEGSLPSEILPNDSEELCDSETEHCAQAPQTVADVTQEQTDTASVGTEAPADGSWNEHNAAASYREGCH